MRDTWQRAGAMLNRRPILWLFFTASVLLNQLSLVYGGGESSSPFNMLAYVLLAILGVIVYGGALYATHEVIFDIDMPGLTVARRFSESVASYSGKLIIFSLIAGFGLILSGLSGAFGFDIGIFIYVLFQPLFLMWPLMILSQRKVFGSFRAALTMSISMYVPLLLLGTISYLIEALLPFAADMLYGFVNKLTFDDVPDIHYIKLLFCFPAGLWMCLRSGMVILLADDYAERRLQA